MSEQRELPVILLAFANDRVNTARYLRNLPDELRNLREALRPGVAAGLCEVVELANATADDIFQVFQTGKYRNRIAVLHYGGHAGGYELLLESADGHAAAAGAGGFAKFLGAQSSLQLVFLNGCSTQRQTQGLLKAGVDGVITTATVINDKVATRLAERFYRALAGGAGLSTAFREATAAAETESGGETRALYAVTEENEIVADRFPWDLYLRPGSESASEWNLPDVARNPLFGLPELSTRDLPATPYRHLQWFHREHADVFFGRGAEIRDLYRKVTNTDTPPIILFYGQSGVGKSSVLDAGLIPRLEASQHVIYLRRDAEQGLSGTLDLAFLPEGVDLRPAEAWHARERALAKPLTIVLDQVEEVFTRPCGAVSDELRLFLDHINAIFFDPETRPAGRLIIGFRKEWLAELKRQLSEFGLPCTEVFLERLSRAGVEEVIHGPSSAPRLQNKYGLKIEPGLAQQIADDLLEDAGGAVAPTLQVLLSRMWEAAEKEGAANPRFTRELYTSMRRQGLLLRDFLNRQLEFVERRWPDVVSPDLLLDLLSLHTTVLGTAEQQLVTELQQAYSHHAQTLPQILEGCRDAWLLTLPGSAADDETATRLAHDTLAPLVRERFEKSDHPGQRARRILENRVVEWQNGATGVPLDEQDLTLVEAGQNGMRAWTPDERRLVAASRVERVARQRGARVRRMIGLAGIAAIAATAAIAFGYAVRAEKQRREAVFHQVEAERATARSLVLPLREREEVTVNFRMTRKAISENELEAMWALAESESEGVHHHVFRAVASEPAIGERVVNRRAELVRAAIGLSAERRHDTLELIEQVLSGPPAVREHPPEGGFSLLPMPLQSGLPKSPEPWLNPDTVDWRVVCACAAVVSELQPVDDELGELIASRLVDEITVTDDPRLLGEIGVVLSDFVAFLSPERALSATVHLLDADLDKTSGSYPINIGKALQAVVPQLDGSSVLPALRESVDVWCTAQHSQKMATGQLILRLAERISEQDAFEAWGYLNEHHERYASYMFPINYCKAMGVVAARSEAAADRIAGTVAQTLQKQESRHQRLAAYDATLSALAQTATPETLQAELTTETQWASPEVEQWVKAAWMPNQAEVHSVQTDLVQRPQAVAAPDPDDSDSRKQNAAIELVNQWEQGQANLNDWINPGNRTDMIAAVTEIATAAESNAYRIQSTINLLAAISQNSGEVDRHSIQRALINRLSQPFDTDSIYEDARLVMNLSLLAIPLNRTATQTVQTRVIEGLQTDSGSAMVDAALSFPGTMDEPTLARVVSIAIDKLRPLAQSKEPAEPQDAYHLLRFARLLTLPGAKVPRKHHASVSHMIRHLYNSVLNPKYGRHISQHIVDLPGTVECLDASARSDIVDQLEKRFLAETRHHELAAFALARVNFIEPVTADARRQMLIKLSLWMYRLPPPIINTSPPLVNTNVPVILAEAIVALAKDAPLELRCICAHSIMHAILQQDFEDVSGRTLRHSLGTLINGLEPRDLINLIKAPWCVGDSQQIVLREIERQSGQKFEGRIWKVVQAHESLGISEEELNRAIVFPAELRYDAPVPAYVTDTTSSGPRPLGQGNPIATQGPDGEPGSP